MCSCQSDCQFSQLLNSTGALQHDKREQSRSGYSARTNRGQGPRMASTQVNPVLSKGLDTARQPNFLEEPNDFSLVLGGPVFQLFRKSHLAGDGLELVHRRLLIITLVAWLPLLLIATLALHEGKRRQAFLPSRRGSACPIPCCTSCPHRGRTARSFANTSRCPRIRRAAHRFTRGPTPLS